MKHTTGDERGRDHQEQRAERIVQDQPGSGAPHGDSSAGYAHRQGADRRTAGDPSPGQPDSQDPEATEA
ncbi:hypothetical protein [Longispora albida]|uniref:hypothetical protein n=1 Tax=Longispora albida TaxID=203523 RepID=UPI00036DA4C1|nr:hypothetical protein [Longispora albida]